jgi:hypothetical protein
LPERPEVYEIKGDTLTIWFEERSSLAYYGSTFGETTISAGSG